MRSFIVTLAVGFSVPVAAAPHAPGCSYLQPQVKQCSVSTIGVGTFDVVVAPPAGLIVTFDEVITGMQPPPTSSYRASFSGATATVVPIRPDPIRGATVHFDTATVHVTLNLRLGRTPDTQLLVVDPRKGVRDEEVERRVKEALDGLEERVRQRAEESLLADIAAAGVEIADTDTSPSRHNQVVIRARKIVRIGSRRVLLFSVVNRSADVLEVKGIRAWIGRPGAEREVTHSTYRFHRHTVAVNEDMAAAVSLPAAFTPSARLRLLVELTDPERNVELGGIRVR